MTEAPDEADRYTKEMWRRHLAQVVTTICASSAKREAFVYGFNGGDRPGIHHTVRPAYALGRHTAILLGYIR